MSIPGTRASGGAKALVKGIAIVDAVARRTPVRLGDLVESAGLPRATTLRLVDVLVEHGLLRTDSTGAYLLGPRLVDWGQRSLASLTVPEQAEDLMADLAATTGETCFLGVRDRHHVLYVAKADGSHAVRPAAQLGTRNPLHCTAMGKVLLASCAESELDTYLAGELEAKTPHTLTEPTEVREEVARTARRGYGTDLVENEDGVRCAAAPIRDHTGAVVAALSVAVPAYRLPEDDIPGLAETVVRTAGRVSERIGYRQRGDTHE